MVNGFSLWVGLGAALGMWRLARSASQQQAEAWVNTGLFILLAALIGARMFYVGENWIYFSTHLLEAPQFWLGGLTWPGAVFGSGVVFLYLAFLFRFSGKTWNNIKPAALPLGWLGDRIYPLLPPLAITAWLGSWQINTAYGAPLPDGTWWGIPGLDETGVSGLHVPLQPLAALTLLIFFWLLETRIKPFRPAGRLSGLAVLGLLLHLLITCLFRADPSPTWQGLRLDTWFAIFYLVVFAIVIGLNSLLLRISHKTLSARSTGVRSERGAERTSS